MKYLVIVIIIVVGADIAAKTKTQSNCWRLNRRPFSPKKSTTAVPWKVCVVSCQLLILASFLLYYSTTLWLCNSLSIC